MELISMTEFVLEQEKKDDPNLKMFSRAERQRDLISQIFKYANFLNQPLTLGMFVPCDEDGNVLKRPVEELHDPNNKDCLGTAIKKMKQYQQAKERLLFEGVKQVKEGLFIEDVCIYHKDLGFLLSQKVEDLTLHFEITLTPTAIKQIGLTKHNRQCN